MMRTHLCHACLAPDLQAKDDIRKASIRLPHAFRYEATSILESTSSIIVYPMVCIHCMPDKGYGYENLGDM